MMRYLKDSEEIKIRVDDPFPEDAVFQYHSALLGLLENMDPNFGITEHQRPLVALLGAFKCSHVQLMALSENKPSKPIEESPSMIIFENGFYLNIKAKDKELGAKIVRSLIFYIEGCLPEADQVTLYYALDLLSKLLPSDEEMNDSFNVK